jgi:hypothetical protein
MYSMNICIFVYQLKTNVNMMTHTPVIPVLTMQRQLDLKLQASMDYIPRTYFGIFFFKSKKRKKDFGFVFQVVTRPPEAVDEGLLAHKNQCKRSLGRD